MISTVERILFLREIPLLSGFSLDELWQVAKVVDEESFEKGETFIWEGDVGDALYLILSGDVLVHQGEKELNRQGPGGMIGELALLDNEPRSASITALTEVQSLRIDRGQFEDIMHANPAAAIGVIKVLTRRLRDQSDRTPGLTKEQMEKLAQEQPSDNKEST